MQISQVPALLPKAFAASGTKNTIPVDSQISVTPGAASLTDGFPPLTMTPLAAGGVPPYGADTNGILNWLSQICQWSNAGGVYPYNAAFSAAIGGYPKGALIQKASGVGYWISSVDNNTTDPDTGGAGWVGFDPSTLQAGSYTSAVDSGSLNALAVTLSPAPTALSAGMQATALNVAATNTAAATLNLNGLGAKPIVLPSGAALSGGEIPGGAAATFVYTGASWMLQTRQPANGVPGATFAEIAAAEADQGPVLVTDMAGELYTWQSSPYFNGYRSARCGLVYGGPWDDPDPWEALLTGGVWSEDDPRLAGLIAKFQEKGRTKPAANWAAGFGFISDIGNGNWKAPDYQNIFLRMSGTDVDTANARLVGAHQGFSVQKLTVTNGTINPGSTGSKRVLTVSGGGGLSDLVADTTAISGTGAETRGQNTAVSPVILI